MKDARWRFVHRDDVYIEYGDIRQVSEWIFLFPISGIRIFPVKNYIIFFSASWPDNKELFLSTFILVSDDSNQFKNKISADLNTSQV